MASPVSVMPLHLEGVLLVRAEPVFVHALSREMAPSLSSYQTRGEGKGPFLSVRPVLGLQTRVGQYADLTSTPQGGSP